MAAAAESELTAENAESLFGEGKVEVVNEDGALSIKLLDNVELEDRCIISGTVILDLNGKTLTTIGEENSGEAFGMKAGADLTVRDSAGGGALNGGETGENYGNPLICVRKDTALTLEGGTLTAASGKEGIQVQGGTFRMTGGKVVGGKAGSTESGGSIESRFTGGNAICFEYGSMTLAGGEAVGGEASAPNSYAVGGVALEVDNDGLFQTDYVELSNISLTGGAVTAANDDPVKAQGGNAIHLSENPVAKYGVIVTLTDVTATGGAVIGEGKGLSGTALEICLSKAESSVTVNGGTYTSVTSQSLEGWTIGYGLKLSKSPEYPLAPVTINGGAFGQTDLYPLQDIDAEELTFKINAGSFEEVNSIGAETLRAITAGNTLTIQHMSYDEYAKRFPNKTSHMQVFVTKGIAGSGTVKAEDVIFGEDLRVTAESATNGMENVTYFYKVKGADDNTFTPEAPKNAGEYTVRAVFAATDTYYEVTATTDFKILPKTLNADEVVVTGMEDSYTLIGGKAEPKPTEVRVGNAVLTEKVDYMLSYQNNTAVGLGTMVLTFTGNYSGTKEVAFRIDNKPGQSLSFDGVADNKIEKTYGDAKFTLTAKNGTPAGGEITYASSDLTVAAVDESTGEVTILGAGETVITAAAAETDEFAAGSVSCTLVVAKKMLTISNAVIGDKTFDGTLDAVVESVAFDEGITLTKDTDYTVKASFNDANAGKGKAITGVMTLIGRAAKNYELVSDHFVKEGLEISKASAPLLTDVSIKVRAEASVAETIALADKVSMPGNAGMLTYSAGSESVTGQVKVEEWEVGNNGTVRYALSGGVAGDMVTLPVTIASDNYENAHVSVTIKLTDRAVPTATAADITVIYTGTAVPASSIMGTASFDGKTVEGTWSWKESQSITNVADSGTKTVVFTPSDDAYETVEINIRVTINKATPAGAPAYTKITAAGKTLKAAGLTDEGGTFSVPGTVKWVDKNGNELADTTVVKANTEYQWKFFPTDAANYESIGGSIKLYSVSNSGGGGGGASAPTYPVSSSNASASAAVGGSVSISTKNATAGSTVTVTVSPEAGYRLEKLTVVDKNGKEIPVTLKDGKYTFTMPASQVEIKPVFEKIPAETAEPTFPDVPSSAYYAEPVKWAAEKGITSGTKDGGFAPGNTCTRAQIVTFLWRAAGSPEPQTAETGMTDVSPAAYYAKAVAWAIENGITVGRSDGSFNPNGTCTRANGVTFLYRAAKAAASGNDAGFSDVTADAYYAAAVQWALENGITNGQSSGLFGPNGACTRAQIVTFLYRMYVKA